MKFTVTKPAPFWNEIIIIFWKIFFLSWEKKIEIWYWYGGGVAKRFGSEVEKWSRNFRENANAVKILVILDC